MRRFLLHAALLGATASAAQAAPVQWTVVSGGNGHYYEVVSGAAISWTDAQTAAGTAGGYLATLTSAAENNFVFGLVNNSAFWTSVDASITVGPWFGLSQQPGSVEPGGGWVWENGEGALGFENWDPAEPNNLNGIEHYGHYFSYLGGPAATWNDIDNANGFTTSYVVEYTSLPAPIPLPASLPLLLAAVGGLGLLRRRMSR